MRACKIQKHGCGPSSGSSSEKPGQQPPLPLLSLQSCLPAHALTPKGQAQVSLSPCSYGSHKGELPAISRHREDMQSARLRCRERLLGPTSQRLERLFLNTDGEPHRFCPHEPESGRVTTNPRLRYKGTCACTHTAPWLQPHIPDSRVDSTCSIRSETRSPAPG